MNYISEVNSFYNWLSFNPLPSGAQALWHYLLQKNCRCAGKIGEQWLWRTEFSVANSTAESILRFSRTQLDRMRNELVQAGRIGYKKGRGNQSGIYKIIPFGEYEEVVINGVAYWKKLVTHYVTQTGAQTVTQTDTQIDTQTDTQDICNTLCVTNDDLCNIMCTLINNNNKQTNNYDDVDDDNNYLYTRAREVYIKNFGKEPSGVELDYIIQQCRKIDFDLIEYAFNQAAFTDNKNMAYVAGILKNFFKRGIKNMGDVAVDDMKRGKF